MTRWTLTALLALLGLGVSAGLLALEPAGAEDEAVKPEGVRVNESGRRWVFEVLKNGRWDEASWRYKRSGYGSGIGYREDGWILATAHQVNGAERIRVVCPDGVARKTKEWVWANGIDLAVIYIPDYEVPVPTFADRPVRVGEPIYGLGHPLDFKNSLVKGIVSGLHRQYFIDGKLPYVFQNYIQIDAQVNAGHSGGPLLNARGELVGIINSSLAILDDGPPAMCFGLPIDVVRTMADRMIEERKAFRAGGLEMKYVNAWGVPLDIRKKHGITSTRGAIIYDLGPEAREGGLKAGDVVLAVDDTPVQTWMHLRVLLAMRKPGTKVSLDIERAGKPMRWKLPIHAWREE